jgi:L-fuculose-phosphate aldolase
MSYLENDQYLTDFQVKKQIIEVGRWMYNKNFVASNDGNISFKVSDTTLWATPTGVSKGFMTEEMLVKVDLDGNILNGTSKPSSELKMHLRVYRENPKVQAVVHAHPPIATSFAIAGIPLSKAILPEAVIQLGEVPVAPYATPGTQEVPDSIAPFCKTHNGVLLANHGALTWGDNVTQAYYRMESLEYYAMVTMYTGIIGQANELSCRQVDKLVDARTRLGITTGGRPVCTHAGKDGVPLCVKGMFKDSCECETKKNPNVENVEEIAEIVRLVIEQQRLS